MAESANIARHLPLMAARQPEMAALKIPRGRLRSGAINYLTLSFAELDAEVDAWVAKLSTRGVRREDRVLVMVRQGLPLIAAAFALFKLGAVPVIIDPGMGRKNFLACVARSKPRILLGIPLAQILSCVFRSTFKTVDVRIWVRGSATARLGAEIIKHKSEIVNSSAGDLAAILFTSGSTGAPKGVCYEHGMFEAQVQLIRDTYDIQPGEVDLPMLPIFALFNPALGMTTIVPEIDPSRPAAVDPAKIVQAILQEGVTNSFGSPTLWDKIALHCITHQLKLPGVRRILCAGAPVPAMLWDKSRIFLPHGAMHSPYGATEALPICSISSSEIHANSTAGACVGRPLNGIEVRIIGLTDARIANISDARALPAGEVGEIIVCGPVVTKAYDALPEATALAKIQTPNFKSQTTNEAQETKEPLGTGRLGSELSAPPNGAVWHRMGDCGYLDTAGRLWFVGRKAERLETPSGPVFTEPCEQVFRRNDCVVRCALIGLGPRGSQTPALVVQIWEMLDPREKPVIARGLRQLALQHPHTAGITKFFFHPSFPVDVRHNAKIHRLTLAQWAATATAYEPDSSP